MSDRRFPAQMIATVVVVILSLSACGSGDELEAGIIERSDGTFSVGGTAEVPEGAPTYCSVAAKIVDSPPSSTLDAILMREARYLDALAVDGPVDVRTRAAALAATTRALLDSGIDLLDAEPALLDDDEREVVIDFAVAVEQFDALTDDVRVAFRADCGDELADRFEQARSTLPMRLAPGPENDEILPTFDDDDDGGEAIPATPERFTDVVDGPFGSAVIANSRFEIIDVTWSNIGPEAFLDDDARPEPTETDRRFVYLTVDITNEDPNDALRLADEHLALVIGDGPIGATEAFAGAYLLRDVEPVSSQRRVLGFEVGTVTPLDDAVLRYQDETVPGFVDVIARADSEPSPYPLEIEPPAPGSYVGNLQASCEVVYTWTVDEAIVAVDLPAPLDITTGGLRVRAAPDTRWLRLDGVITTGDVQSEQLCVSDTGVINRTSLRLIIDGRPIAPEGAPNVAVSPNETVPVDVFWSIPVDAETVVLAAVDRDGAIGFESPIELPDLPAVRGE